MIDLTGCIAMPLLKKSTFTGSYQGMRYLMKKEKFPHEEGGEEEDCIRAVVWPEPFSFPATPDEQKESKDFPFCQDGLDEAVRWLNEIHEKKFKKA